MGQVVGGGVIMQREIGIQLQLASVVIQCKGFPL